MVRVRVVPRNRDAPGGSQIISDIAPDEEREEIWRYDASNETLEAFGHWASSQSEIPANLR